MAPFYVWFAVVTLFLMAVDAADFFPVAAPVPWTGILLLLVVLSVSGLPLLYGRVYVRDAMLGFSRESSTQSSGSEGEARATSDVGDTFTSDFRLEEDLFGGEVFPLLGSRHALEAGRNSDIEGRSLTWKECLRVSGAAKAVYGIVWYRYWYCCSIRLQLLIVFLL